jgi:hypothetical protein
MLSSSSRRGFSGEGARRKRLKGFSNTVVSRPWSARGVQESPAVVRCTVYARRDSWRRGPKEELGGCQSQMGGTGDV